MKRVLEVFGEPIISGGQEAFVNNVIESIDWDGLCIDLFTPYYCNNMLYKSNVERRGGKVFVAGLPFKPGSSRFNIEKPLKMILRDRKYDVVHVHSGSVSVLAIVAKVAKENKVGKIIVHSHSPAEHETLKHILVKMLFYRTLLKCPAYYLSCSLNAALCKFPKNIATKKTQFIQNGINLKKYNYNLEKRFKIRKELQIEDDVYLLGHVGRFSKEKNHTFLLIVMEKLIALGENARLVLIGDGELKKQIQNDVISMNLDKYIIFTGSVTNVDEYMQAMDCFLLPSLYEGLPFVGVEAQASGMPVIVSTGVSPELKLTNSVQYEVLDANKWVDRIKRSRYLSREDNISELRAAGFDIVQTANILRNIYMG